MFKFRYSNRLGLFLICLMLVNTSMAAEILSHESHSHDVTTMHQEQSATDHTSHLSDDPAHMGAIEQPLAPDCQCDDVCCVGTAGFATASGSLPIALQDSNPIRTSNLYQSILLDLASPPPNA